MKNTYPRYEFDLTIKKIIDANDSYNNYLHMDASREAKEEVTEELTEELKFKSLSAIEVLRRLIDYIKTK